MTISIGTDIVEIDRFEKILARQGDAFVERVLTLSERQEFERRKRAPAYLAKRFAVKEAVAKALKTGIGRGVSFQDINTSNDENGVPQVDLTDGALVAAQRLGGQQILISIADEKAYAIAYAVLV